MPFQCTVTMTGIPPERSHNAFIQSYRDTSSPKYYKKHQQRIESFFQEKLTQNIQQAQVPSYLSNTFNVNFKNDGIYFTSTSKQALKYEFGSGNIPPKHFIEPALKETANEVSNIMITDAIDLYSKYTRLL